MSSKPETNFYTAVNKLLPAGVYALKIHLPYERGVPDLWYSGNLGDLWVEYKKGERSSLSPDQIKWLIRRSHEGRKCYIVTEHATNFCYIQEPSRLHEDPVVSSIFPTPISRAQLARWIESHVHDRNSWKPLTSSTFAPMFE